MILKPVKHFRPIVYKRDGAWVLCKHSSAGTMFISFPTWEEAMREAVASTRARWAAKRLLDAWTR